MMQYVNKRLAQMGINKIDRTPCENSDPSLLTRDGNYLDIVFQSIFRKFEIKREEAHFLNIWEQRVLSHAKKLKTELRALYGEIYNESQEPSPLVGLSKKTSAMEYDVSNIDGERTPAGASPA
jgi:hypothetical protein